MTNVKMHLSAAAAYATYAQHWIARAAEDAYSEPLLGTAIEYTRENIAKCLAEIDKADATMTRYEPVRLMTAVESCKVANEIVEIFTQACANGMVAGSVNDQELCDGHDHE